LRFGRRGSRSSTPQRFLHPVPDPAASPFLGRGIAFERSQTAKELLKTLGHSIAYVGNRNINGSGQPVLILAPQHARLIALGGYSKADVKRYLWEHARVRFGDIPRGNLVNYSEHNLKFYADFGDEARVPIAERAEDIVIVVMGGTGTHSLSVQTRLASENVTVVIARKDGTPWKPD